MWPEQHRVDASSLINDFWRDFPRDIDLLKVGIIGFTLAFLVAFVGMCFIEIVPNSTGGKLA